LVRPQERRTFRNPPENTRLLLLGPGCLAPAQNVDKVVWGFPVLSGKNKKTNTEAICGGGLGYILLITFSHWNPTL
jgi:hypothetical protein